jgi:hypothetical protein
VIEISGCLLKAIVLCHPLPLTNTELYPGASFKVSDASGVVLANDQARSPMLACGLGASTSNWNWILDVQLETERNVFGNELFSWPVEA